ncbi:MAG: DUF1559 domain-containing protein [Lentisphaerae bacterium]|nr:DUF1559 domain-containing protein [Lentisphaerota bacterium]
MENFFGFFPQHGKPVRRGGPAGAAGFSLIELLASLTAVALLAALLAGTLPAALAAARSATCRSNLRQLVAANHAYAADHGRFVAAAADIDGPNSIRWHGVRSGGQAFDGSRGPLAPYLGGGGGSAGVRRCPAFQPEAADFEASCGGYGYNAHGVGSEVCLPNGAGTALGMRPTALARPAQTLMFADTAYLQGSGNRARLIEYSFAEPVQFASGGTPWPTIHFRHRGRANVAWCDGHVTAEPFDRSEARFASHALGWFAPADNRAFDPF